MALRLAALLIAIVAISLTVFDTYNSPKDYSKIIADCRNDNLAPNDAILACTTLIEHPDIPDKNLHHFLGNRAWAFRRVDDYENAISDMDHALELQPNNINMWVRRAYINNASGAIEDAAKDFSKALELDLDSVSTLMHRAKQLNLRGDFKEALQDYEQVLLLEPLNDRAAGMRVGIHIKLENYDQAIDLLNQAATIWPEKHYIQGSLGRLYYHHSEDYEKSLRAFSRLSELEPSDLHDLFFPGMVNLKLGNKNLGKDYIERYAELFDKNAFSDEGIFAGTIKGLILRVLLGKNPQYLYRGIAYSAAEQPDLARIEFARYIESGGSAAVKGLRNILIQNGYCPDNGCKRYKDDDFKDALSDFIGHLGSTFTLDALKSSL